jgi:hypothetical protein
MISPCNYDLSCVCGSSQINLLDTVTACFSTQPGTPCVNDSVAEEVLSYGQNVFCNASDENGVVFDVVSGQNTSTLALDTQAGQAEVRNPGYLRSVSETGC